MTPPIRRKFVKKCRCDANAWTEVFGFTAWFYLIIFPFRCLFKAITYLKHTARRHIWEKSIIFCLHGNLVILSYLYIFSSSFSTGIMLMFLSWLRCPFTASSDIKIIFQSPYLVSAMKIEENISIRRACQPSTSLLSPLANERTV